jgi:hypothetical protein
MTQASDKHTALNHFWWTRLSAINAAAGHDEAFAVN